MIIVITGSETLYPYSDAVTCGYSLFCKYRDSATQDDRMIPQGHRKFKIIWTLETLVMQAHLACIIHALQFPEIRIVDLRVLLY